MFLPDLNPSLRRTLLSLVVITLLAAPALASESKSPRNDRTGESASAKEGSVDPNDGTNRRRPARPNRDASASLTGRVLDSVSSAAVFEAVVTVQGREVVADQNGSFSITGLAAGPTTVRIERWGYEPTTRPLTLASGANSLGNVTLVGGPVVRLTDTNGTTHRLSADSTEFATAAALSSYVILSPAEFCRTDGTIEKYSKSEIASLVGPGVPASGACCPADAPGLQLTLNLKSGPSFPVIMRLCEYYKYDFYGRSLDSGEWIYRTFASISRIEFP